MYKAQTNAPSAGMTTPANMLTTAPVGGATPQPASGGNPQQLTNPCTQQAIANNQLYFPFPGDDSSYIQVTSSTYIIYYIIGNYRVNDYAIQPSKIDQPLYPASHRQQTALLPLPW